MTVDVDALDKLREAATPGPWDVRWQCPEEPHHHDWDEGWIANPDGATVAVMAERYTSAAADAAYIVAMHAALPDLIAEVRRGRALREAVEGLAEELEGWQGNAVRFAAHSREDATTAAMARARAMAYGRAIDSLRDLLAAVDAS